MKKSVQKEPNIASNIKPCMDTCSFPCPIPRGREANNSDTNLEMYAIPLTEIDSRC